MAAYGKFHVELRYIEELHLGTIFAYDQTLNHVQSQVEEGYRDPSNSFKRTLSSDYWLEVVAPNADILRHKMRNDFLKHLRETLFVRVITILEVFLIDIVREVFLARKDLFHRDDRVEMSHAQLLSYDSVAEIATYLINKECRTLQNSGFEKLTAYFDKRLGINFKQLWPDYSEIVEYHNRRHLLVHRLGRTDAQYRHDYGVKEERLTISKRYLLICFEKVRRFAQIISDAARAIRKQGRAVRKLNEPTCIAFVNLEILSDRGQIAIDQSHSFANQEQVVLVGDLLQSLNRNEDRSYTLEFTAVLNNLGCRDKSNENGVLNGYSA